MYSCLADNIDSFILTAESEVKVLEELTKSQVAAAYLLGRLKLKDIDLFNFQLAVMNGASGWIGQVIGEKISSLKKISFELTACKSIFEDLSRGSLTREKAAAYRSLYLKLKSLTFQFARLYESFQVFYEKIENAQEETLFRKRSNINSISETNSIVSICSDFQLTENDYFGLVQYLNLNALIFRCKYASEGISTNKWKRFEAIILTSTVKSSRVKI